MELTSKLWHWLNEPRSAHFDDYGPRTLEELAEQLALRAATQEIWSIVSDGEVVGYIAFAPQSPVCGQFHGMVIAPGMRRKGIGRAAMRAAMDQLIEKGFEKLISMPFEDNEAIMELLARLGFEMQGWLTKATRRGGHPLDLCLMCWTKGEGGGCLSEDS